MKRMLVLLVLAPFCLPAVPAANGQDAPPAAAKPEAPLTAYFDGLTLGEGIVAGPLVVFPVLAPQAPAPIDVVPHTRTDQVLVEEMEWPEKPFNVGITNLGAEPALFLGGEILVGGRLDRMVPGDVLVPGKHQVEIETLPAEYPRDRRREPVPFRRGLSLAPEFLRERAVFDPSRYMVPIFISHFLEFRNAGDKRQSLQAIDDSSALAEHCVECQRAIAEFPDMEGGRVIGFVTAVRGRIHTLEMFGTNDLLRAWFGPILRAHTYAAAAIALRAEKLGIPLPKDEAELTRARPVLAAEAGRILDALGQAKFRAASNRQAAAAGTSFLVRTPQSQGSAILLDDRVLHVAIYPQDPFEEALFSRPIQPPPESNGMESTFGELDRREGRGTLTEEEQRILDRMRERRR